jgi:hypothetical protein
MFSSSLPPVVCRKALHYFCLFAYSGVQRILCCALFCCLSRVYPMLPVSLDCKFLIVPSVFSNVYLAYPPQRICNGVYWFHHVRPSVCRHILFISSLPVKRGRSLSFLTIFTFAVPELLDLI